MSYTRFEDFRKRRINCVFWEILSQLLFMNAITIGGWVHEMFASVYIDSYEIILKYLRYPRTDL